MTSYVILENPDGTERALCPKDNMRFHDKDVDDQPMRVVQEFEAPSWDEAVKVYNDR